uniref:SJCHGC06588 protein n=1 Tax=Schistosoma japonicum TaxID=6182 RepID=Q5DF04_SCHJA|nr:SJCHGC06588 protein [Schistosoma japonicum]
MISFHLTTSFICILIIMKAPIFLSTIEYILLVHYYSILLNLAVKLTSMLNFVCNCLHFVTYPLLFYPFNNNNKLISSLPISLSICCRASLLLLSSLLKSLSSLLLLLLLTTFLYCAP